MSEHDPLCPTNQNDDPDCWFCDLIAKVRANEQVKQPDLSAVTRAIMDMALPMVYDMLRTKVMALPDEHHYGPAGKNRCIKRADILALFDGTAVSGTGA